MIRFRMRRTRAKVFLVMAVLVFGIFIKIGYAYLSRDLSIDGLTLLPKNTWDVHFVENSIVETDNLNSCLGGDDCSSITQHATVGQDEVSVSFGVEFHVIGDYYEFTVDVVNAGTIDAMLNEVIKEGLNGNNDYLDFAVTYADGMPLAQYDQLLKNGGTETLKVKVTFVGKPDEDVNANLGVTVNYIQADGSANSRSYDPETRIRSLNTLNTSIADDDPDGNLRFIGANPDNYVWFNNQKWRIIGVFDGRLKLIQESIGEYSWDTSKNDVNSGYGINQWGPNDSGYTGAAIMKLLNPGYETNTDLKCKKMPTLNYVTFTMDCGDNTDSNYSTGLVNNSLYWTASSGKCYAREGNYGVVDCDFTTTGLSDAKSKNMIDNATWYLGANSIVENPINEGTLTASYLYNMERSSNNGKHCNNDSTCNDTVERTTRWQGKVGLIYPSDYAYATGGGNTYSRSDCLGYYIGNRTNYSGWTNTYTECSSNDWLFDSSAVTSTISPMGVSYSNYNVFIIDRLGSGFHGSVRNTNASYSYSIRPTVYLKPGVVFTNEGNGKEATPFVLRDIANTNTVTFNANGGTISPTTRQVNGGSSIGTLPTPTAPAGKIFDGWYTSSTGGSKVSSSYIPTTDVTLYAHWIQVYDPETRIRSLNTLGTTIADDDPDGNLRFIGANPNNYVRFNNQTWRIIGVFDGKLKIIQESIGNYAWDSSKENAGWGVNQWGPSGTYTGAAIMKLLNPGYETNTDLKCKTEVIWELTSVECNNNKSSDYSTGLVNNSLYWNATSGKCYTFGNHNVGDCDFASTGLSDAKSKNMIDEVTWHLGTSLENLDPSSNESANASFLYNMERSNNNGKQCVGASNTHGLCDDTVERTTTWQGKVGLMYPSDYAYATGGGNTYSRSDCLGFYIGSSSSFSGWSNTYTECSANDWLKPNEKTWTISSRGHSTRAVNVHMVDKTGYVNGNGLANAYAIRPVVYLKSNVKFTGKGNGKNNNPFVLKEIE